MYKDSNKAYIKSFDEYQKVYKNSISNNPLFWEKIADRISWYDKWDTVSNVDYKKADIKWFEGAKLNVSYNCIDRHIENGYGDKTALIWEGNDPSQDKAFTYSQLLDKVATFANALKKINIRKGLYPVIYNIS